MIGAIAAIVVGVVGMWVFCRLIDRIEQLEEEVERLVEGRRW